MDSNVEEPAKDQTKAPSDEELGAMLDQASGRKRKKKRDDTLPSPRLPEALYYYLFMLIEAAIVLGVWGFMKRGPREVLRGPTVDDPIGEQLGFHLASIWHGLGDVLTVYWYIPLAIALGSGAVFVPRTPRGRKRMATLVSSLVVGVVILMIAMQFSDDMASASTYSGF